jgi:nucleoporin GLE1
VTDPLQDVDNAIREAERKLAEENAARAVEERRLKDEEEARIAAAEKEALAKKAELERQAKEKAEKEAADKAAEVAALAKAEADKAEEEKKAAVAAQASRSSTEWAKWVAIQQRMKKDVIEVVKANKQVKTLRPMLGRITRFLGQVINSQEVILRVTNDIDTLLVEQLGKRPSAADPVLFDSSFPPTYGYMLSHTSKALIKQAENEVSAKTEAAFPLGRVVLGLILRGHGAFATVFFARLVKKCPWIIPHYPVRAPVS